jgi:hypothetical protein
VVDAPVIVLAAVVALLVVTAIVLAFVLLPGGGTSSPGAAAPSPRATTSARVGSATGSAHTFTLPSRNITCEVSAGEARCGIATLAKKPAPVEGCAGTVGYVVVVDADGKVTAPCVPSNQQPYAAGGGVKVLDYGKKVTVGDLTCASSKEGVRCTDKGSGKGFTLARAGAGTF